ncbi:restriction endonuclease subunit S [Vibrio antiquarius]|uniref:restriction endonuclease subunit S n=1 Tax=Vibrio antiquarius (strain Ex25) TaxID=150340 RepID=UPI00265CBB21|nr:restriction endonuclease subunit S [Vibrio antiquarius]MCR9685383.1 restriction endonuclease subunit S [Vibrio antiquarius]
MSFKRVPLGELLDGKGYIRGPFGSALKRADMHESGIPVYEQQHAIYGHRDFRYFIQDDKFQKLNRFQVQSNDLIISCSGTVGRISIIKESDPQGIISQALLILRVDSQKLLPDFLYYFLTSPVGKRELLNASQGAVQQNIAPRAVVEKIEVPLPDMSIQKLIVNQLKNLDKKVWVNTTINETLEEMAQAIFKSWFVDFDPVKTKMNGEQPEGMDAATASLFPEKLVESELGLIPEGWEAKQLKDILELAYGKALKKIDRVEGDVPVYGSGGLTGYHNQSLVEGPGIIVGRKGTVGSVYWEPKAFYPIDTVFYVKPKAGYSLNYCYLILQNLGLKNMNTDAAVPGLNRNNAYRLEVVTPSQGVLNKFESLMSAFQSKIDGNNAENSSLETLRDTLLPKLLSGEIELDVERVNAND